MIGGYGRGWRHRRWYYATGTPGYGRGRRFWAYPPQVPPDMIYPDVPPGYAEPYVPFVPTISEQDELKMLEEEEQFLRQELEELTAAIKELKEKMNKEVKK
ncbi:MAG: DUF5320 domain-containing protein [Candidatus Thermoplasmatota archaeon]|nr:DUF5320 domain-containing protein [Candidatus Thermoplasmatota archaeon]